MKKDLNYYLNLPYDILIKKIPQEEGGSYSAFMPDFKEIAFFYGDGDTPQEALKDLREAFEATLESMINRGVFIPEPNQTDKTVRLNITLPQRIVNIIDAKAKEMCLNRSALIADLARKAFM
ncbi:type II toxin-antitoxin system HicB family antitoxin [Helicobacter sp. 13S00477-4]|uniref:type II toxin-antitoxin system HicB family antitoxin n=1 Tax=Helicobacter sp. 13S00477-4 TaxID=1905759 RepID=UPI000BA5184A|nr:type II toxin-antitoxin system HicB family antitoxin [Helicobacter sp. 13S00477-4]PAF50839.1 HicB family protein [Helicobacter sp. 13S00477-4]